MEVKHQPHKACPVVIREATSGLITILAFEHPFAGKQLVKGSIEENENPSIAALRELKEESGIENAELVRFLVKFEVGPPSQKWHAYLCRAAGIEESWTFFTNDDGGHEFNFFWHNIDDVSQEGWHPIYRQALDHIRTSLNR